VVFSVQDILSGPKTADVLGPLHYATRAPPAEFSSCWAYNPLTKTKYAGQIYNATYLKPTDADLTLPYAEAACAADGGDNVTAMAEREQRKIRPDQLGDFECHGCAPGSMSV
jgi:hypothetical protein